MLDALRTPTGRIAFGLAASAVLVVLTLMIEPGMVAILPALLVPIWIPLLGAERLNTPKARRVRWALTALFAGTFLFGLLVFLVSQQG